MNVRPSPFATPKSLSRAEAQLVRSVNVNVNINVNVVRSRSGFDICDKGRPKCGNDTRPPGRCHTSPPHRNDSCHPKGSMKVDKNGTVTTPGGYKVEVLGPHEWKITGPDKKTTRVWGDPHVAEGDGGKWDFKRDSTFVLGDGTRINVGTKPSAPNVTVTDSLEIISGNDRVKINDVGKGKNHPPAKLTHDGFAHANSFGGKDVFVMGRETDDWSFKGREVIGSKNNGESFVLGGKLPAGGPRAHPSHGPRGPQLPGPAGAAATGAPNAILPGEPNPAAAPADNPFTQQLNQFFQELTALFTSLTQVAGFMEGCHFGDNDLCAPGTQGNWLDRRQQHLSQNFNDIGQMMNTFTRMDQLRLSLNFSRGSFNA
jgi:hypothetical protein